MRIRLGDYPQLMSIAWHIADELTELTPQEAFNLYERNWRHVEQDRLLPKERVLIEVLKNSIGNGIMLV